MIDVVGIVAGWAEKLLGVRSGQRAANTRVADRALPLRRQLVASYEAWPQGPRTREELVTWAFKIASGFPVTEPALAALVEQRPGASPSARRAVGVAQKEYYAIADTINPLIPAVFDPRIKRSWEPQGGPDDAERLAAGERALRRAWAHVRRLRAALDSASAAVKD